MRIALNCFGRAHRAELPLPRGSMAAYAFALLWIATSTAAVEPGRFGVIEWVTGQAEVINARGQSRPARASEPILAGETIQTGAQSELHVRTEDAGFVSIRQNSQIKIDSYLAVGLREDTVAISLVRGALRSITGWIGGKNPQGYRVRTPTATVGIRGTDHETHYVPPHDGSNPGLPAPGTYDKVNAGGTVLRNMGGEVAIGPNQSAHAPNDGRTSPRVLDRTPNIFRPGMNDSRIEMRKMELAREVAARLADRPGGAKDVQDLKDLKDLKDGKDGKDIQDLKDVRDAKDAKDTSKDRTGKDDARRTPDRTRRKPGDR